MAHALHNLVLHQVKRDLLYFWQQFYLWHPVKMLSIIFLVTLSSLASGKTQSNIFLTILLSLANGENAIYYISDNIFFLISGENVISFIFGNIFVSGFGENVISFISAKIFISGIRWKRDLSLFLATFGNLGSHFCTSLANFIKVPVHYSQQWRKKIIAIT